MLLLREATDTRDIPPDAPPESRRSRKRTVRKDGMLSTRGNIVIALAETEPISATLCGDPRQVCKTNRDWIAPQVLDALLRELYHSLPQLDAMSDADSEPDFSVCCSAEVYIPQCMLGMSAVAVVAFGMCYLLGLTARQTDMGLPLSTILGSICVLCLLLTATAYATINEDTQHLVQEAVHPCTAFAREWSERNALDLRFRLNLGGQPFFELSPQDDILSADEV